MAEPILPNTPLMRQYLEIKGRHPDAILFFRVGDFYEMFLEDAVTASKILQITLTTRDKEANPPVPLCGVPHHAARAYIAKLIAAGRSVALCEQMEPPEAAKLVRREVVRVITPGTLIEPEILAAKEPNYIAALAPDGLAAPKTIGLAVMDLSTGDFRTLERPAADAALEAEISAVFPREVLLPIGATIDLPFPADRVRTLPVARFDPRGAKALLCGHFNVASLAGLGCEAAPFAAAAAGALLSFVQETQKVALANVTRLKTLLTNDHLLLNATTQRHLEIVQGPERIQDRRGKTLFEALDETRTAMGGRLLREWLLHPLIDKEAILDRHEAVSAFFSELPRRGRLRALMSRMGDLERLIGRIGLVQAQPRDLSALAGSLGLLPEIRKELQDLPAKLIRALLSTWDDLDDVAGRIARTLADDPPATLNEPGLIREGCSPGLDELRAVRREGKGRLLRLEAAERAATRIESLKVKYNQVFGYYIEVTRPNLAKVPPSYQRKQTLANAERFTTPELIELEGKILGAEEKMAALESELFEALRRQVAGETVRIQKMARAIARLDVLLSFAETASRWRYCRPEILDDRRIEIREGRHPVLEQLAPSGTFVPNDTELGGEGAAMVILTGPNMAGKSTYMRQVGLIVLMAQAGSYVPAREARIGIVDRIFTRVGAQDDIASGQSTFMVEMNEMAAILHHATERSLLLLDEIGRGTSTYDGVSIAWAIAEYIRTHLSCRTFFATHYHELTRLPSAHPGIRNANVAVREWNDEVIFLRKIVEGACDKSYGIQVARLAGLPKELLERAKEILAGLEEGRSPVLTDREARPEPDLFSPAPAQPSAPSSLIERLRSLDPDRITPLDALAHLAELRRLAGEEKKED